MNADRLMKMNKKKAMELIGCNPLTCKSRYVNCSVVEFDGKCMCTELRNLIKMDEFMDFVKKDMENNDHE
jgi:hypothetical protein